MATLDKKTNVKKPAGAPPQIVNNKIEIRPYHRTEQDIPKWRQAIQSAESQIPRRYLLYNLYADVDLDGHVEAVTGKRRDPIKAANWQFVDKEGMPVDEINDVIDTIGFDDLLEEVINARFWGYSMLEPRFWKDASDKWQMDAGLIPRLNYRPEIGVVSFDIHGDEGINIREGIYAKTIMEVGKITDLGLYMKAAPYAILKRGGWGDYAAFIQTFGTPLIDATWDGFDETQRIKLTKSLEEIGAGGVIIRPAGTTIEVKENNVAGTSTAHGDFISGLNREISKALLGSTETTESSKSSGYAQSETHSDQDELKHMNDLSYTRKVLNSRFIKILQAYGFDTKGGEFIIQGEEQELTKKESFEIHKGLVTDLKLPIDDEFLYETYGIPRPDKYEQMKRAMETPPEPENKPTGLDPGKKPKPQEKPKKGGKEDEEPEEVKLTEKAWYLKLFERFFVKAPAETTGATCGHHHTIKLAESDLFDDDALIQRVWDSQGKLRFDFPLFYHTANTLILGFKKGWDTQKDVKLADAPGFAYDYDDPAVLTAHEQNLYRFTGAKTLAEAHMLNRLYKESKSFNEFYRKAKKLTGKFNKHWLETEYITANLAGESTSTYHRLKAQAHIFPYWKYTTAGDHLVRPEHAMLDDLILPVDDPRWKKLYPPNGWSCRCYVVPRMRHEFDESQLEAMRARADLYLGSTQFKKEKAQGWGVNRAEAGEVFTANQQYVNKFPGKAAKLLSNLKPSDFELQSYSQAKKVATADLPEFKADPDEFYSNLEKLNRETIVRDYKDRPLAVDKVTLSSRVHHLKALSEAMKQPDEVWLQGELLDRFYYVKYYNNSTFIAEVKVNNGKAAEVLDFFALDETIKGNTLKYRKGLLILKK